MKEFYRYCKRSSIQEAFVFQIFTGINSYKASFELRCIVCDNKIVAISTKPLHIHLSPGFELHSESRLCGDISIINTKYVSNQQSIHSDLNKNDIIKNALFELKIKQNQLIPGLLTDKDHPLFKQLSSLTSEYAKGLVDADIVIKGYIEAIETFFMDKNYIRDSWTNKAIKHVSFDDKAEPVTGFMQRFLYKIRFFCKYMTDPQAKP